MSKFLIAFITLSMLILIGGCSVGDVNSKSPDASLEQQSSLQDSIEQKKSEETIIADGDIIKTESLEITVNKATLTYDVLPKSKNTIYTHYEAKDGKVYIDVDVSVKNKEKNAILCDEVMEVEADYNNGYKYSGFPVVEDSVTGFTYANISNIDPLETIGMRFLVDCPKEVEETNNPLFLIFDVNEQKYKYILRDGKTTKENTENQTNQPIEQTSLKETKKQKVSVDSKEVIKPSGEELNAKKTQEDYSNWIPYSTGSAQTLAEVLASGNVVYYNGQYLASPEYAEMLANANVVYENDISEGASQTDRFALADVEISFDEIE